MRPSTTLGVLIPTRNSAALLPSHLSAMADWIELANEIVVVDSFSADSTLALLQDGLKGRPVRFISHPPGLYASWNAGIQRLTTEFTYISTVGDTISRTGMERLLSTAIDLRSDVVISKPVFKRTNGSEPHIEWPIDDVRRTLAITAPRLLNAWEAILFASTHPTAALTGSCASDLFRTAVLQRWPFPTDFGTAGDGIWGIRYAPLVAWAVLSETFSTFLLHSTDRSQAENRPAAHAPSMSAVLANAAELWSANGAFEPSARRAMRWDELLSALQGYLCAKETFDRKRKQPMPWILNPSAWGARLRRSREAARVQSLRKSALRAAQTTRRENGAINAEGNPDRCGAL